MTQVLWVDKYRPRQLDKLELHEDVNRRLKKLVRTSSLAVAAAGQQISRVVSTDSSSGGWWWWCCDDIQIMSYSRG